MPKEAKGDPPAQPTRRRDEVLLRAIFDATIAELQDAGFHGVTFEGVARRAQTSKPVLYRRFQSRAELVAAAIDARLPLPTEPRCTGPLREQLLELFALHEGRYQQLGAGVVRGLLAELPQAHSTAMLAEGAEKMLPPLRALIRSASERGELGPEPIPETVIASAMSLLRYEFLTIGRVPERSEIETLLDLIYLPLLKLHSGAIALAPE